jgi:uncharacterized protein DUF4159
MRSRRMAGATLLAVLLAGVVSAATAEQPPFRGGGRRGRFGFAPRMATKDAFDGGFNFCRIMFDYNPYGDGGGWNVDYPRADQHLSIRLSELTKTRVSFDENTNPNHFVLQLTDPLLFKCPFIMMTEVGALYLSDEEAKSLREYLQKGGFLWADDFWGEYAWQVWAEEIAKALPPGEYPTVDLPIDHPLFRTLYTVERFPQIPAIGGGRWGTTSERGADSAVPHARAIFDKTGRMMVFISHNTDFGDSWEREGDDPDYFYRFSVDGYAVGVDVVLYALSH